MKSLNNLIEQLRTYGGLPILLVKQIFKQVFLAIDYIHHCGVIHTDLKPENILIEIKDIMRLIKMIENDKIAKHNERKRSNSSNASSMSTVQLESPLLSPHSRKGSSVSSSFPHSRKTSTVSNSSFASIGYSRSRITRKFSNSINSHTSESPIRSSKPLPSSITTDIMFKNISYKYDSPKSVSGSGDFAVHSPTEMSHSVKSNLSLDGNSKEDNMISVKIADLGNGTFANTHFTDQIQTRQYRSPEIILGYKKWGALTDLWSIGCMIFELITGDYLFEPHDGKHYDRDDDHMAQIVELLGGFPTKEYLNQCRFAKDFFKFDPSQPSNADVKFRKIPQLKYWPLKNVLIEKYHFSKDDPNVALISDLISKCLRYDPRERIDAGSLSNHPWFNNCGNFDHLEKINGHLELETKGVDIPGYSSPYSVDDEKSEISVSQVSDSTEGVIGVAEIHVDETPIGNLS